MAGCEEIDETCMEEARKKCRVSGGLYEKMNEICTEERERKEKKLQSFWGGLYQKLND